MSMRPAGSIAMRSRRRSLGRRVCVTLILVAVLHVGCTRPKAATGNGAPATGNAALDAALAREIALTDEFRVAPESRAFTTRVPLRPTLSVGDGFESMAMQFPDAGGDVTCFVYSEEGDLGGLALTLGRAGIELLKQRGGEFSFERIYGSYAGAVGGTGYHGMAWLLAGSGGSAQPKAIAANKHGRGLACLHFDLGFSETFEGVFRSFVENFAAADPPPAPYFSEIMVSRIGTMKVGIESTELTRDRDGDTRILTRGSTLIPVGPNELSAAISFRQVWSQPDGSLINALVIGGDEDSVHTNLSLRWVDQQGWRASGTFQGKDLEVFLPHSEPIDTKLREYDVMTRLLAPHGERMQAEMVEWVPDIDPTDAVASTISLSERDPSKARVEFVGLSFDVLRGEDGLLESAEIPVGASTIRLDVIHREGGF